MANLTGIDHVLLSMPRGGEGAARAFYGDVLGLREVPKPPPLDTHGGCWFVSDTNRSMAVHLGVEEPFVPARKAHVALLVDDLEGLRAMMRDADVETRDDDAPIGVRRFYAFDPFGNRLELVDAADAAFTDR
ncbi:MAG TPA: VOC family protein [Candidatus Limnocylindrales bacterium]|nr:VOC family protein [Candidatus Limnocylindrales bacterium]